MSSFVFRKLLRKSPKSPTLMDVIDSLINTPKNFFHKFKRHIVFLLPLIAVQLLQRFQDLVDDRNMNILGKSAAVIHNIQYNYALLGLELGLASATSALILWKRKEMQQKQGTLLLLHLALPAFLGVVVAILLSFYIPEICRHFNLSSEFSSIAPAYLEPGLVNLIFRSLYVTTNVLLIAANQRAKTLFCALGMIVTKIVVGYIAVHSLWDQTSSPASILLPMKVIALGSTVSFGVVFILSVIWLSKGVDGWEKVQLKTLLKIWPGELLIGLSTAFSSILFTFELAKANVSGHLFVTYQLACHLISILALPATAGIQLAVRDASAEYSEVAGMQYKPLHESHWWPQYFYASLAPTLLFLIIVGIFFKPIFQKIYYYNIPEEHLVFLPIYFLSGLLWQFGHVFLVVLRASQKNGLATRNFLIAGMGIQVGLTQVLLWLQMATPLFLGLIIALNCLVYLVLNWQSTHQVQSKFYFLKHRSYHFRLPKPFFRLPQTFKINT